MINSMVRYLLRTIIVLSALQSVAFAQADSSDAQRSIVRSLVERFHLNPRFGLRMLIDPDGSIRNIETPLLNAGLTSSQPLDRAYEFLERHGDIFHLANPRQELILKDSVTSDSPYSGRSAFINFEQVVNGIKVLDGGFGFHFKSDSSNTLSILSVGSSYYTESRNINTTPTISMERAKEIALSDPAHNGLTPGIYKDPELYIDRIDGVFHLIWRLGVLGGGYNGAALYIIDAHSGQILVAKCSII